MLLIAICASAFAQPLFPHQEQLLPIISHSEYPKPQTIPNVSVYGYLPYWTEDVATVDLNGLSHVAYFDVGLEQDGSLSNTSRWTDNASTLVSRAHAQGVQVHLTLTSFQDSVNNTVLSESSLRAVVVEQLTDLVVSYEADGINIDIEGLDASQRNNLNLFVAELSQHISDIVVATPAVDWSDAYDYAYLSQYATLFVMGYDYHWSGGDPGPVDPLYGSATFGHYALDWTVSDYLSHGVPKERIILGLPLYGRRWSTVDNELPSQSTGVSSSITFSEAHVAAAQEGSLYHEESRTPYVLYPTEQIWFGTTDSLRERIRFSMDYGLQGIGLWALGYESEVPDVWTMIAEETTSVPSQDDTGSTSRNDPPTAEAGEDRTEQCNKKVHLDGSYSSDPNGNPLTFYWEQQTGPTVEVMDPDTATPYFIASTAGLYTFDLVVSDGDLQDQDTVIITIEPPVLPSDEEAKRQSCTSVPMSAVFWPIVLFAIIERRQRNRHARHILSQLPPPYL